MSIVSQSNDLVWALISELVPNTYFYNIIYLIPMYRFTLKKKSNYIKKKYLCRNKRLKKTIVNYGKIIEYPTRQPRDMQII